MQIVKASSYILLDFPQSDYKYIMKYAFVHRWLVMNNTFCTITFIEELLY